MRVYSSKMLKDSELFRVSKNSVQYYLLIIEMTTWFTKTMNFSWNVPYQGSVRILDFKLGKWNYFEIKVPHKVWYQTSYQLWKYLNSENFLLACKFNIKIKSRSRSSTIYRFLLFWHKLLPDIWYILYDVGNRQVSTWTNI